ncbi:MAG: pantoate--beta-alanine ligase [Firmicutes bacterium]|nr:pantoate--beta-alanine ligase [Bacillota bacterium]
MKVVHTIKEVREQVKAWRTEGLSVGLVPTMGFLHEGHKSLIDSSVKDNDRTVVSVFVNPMQFGPSEDLANYPRDLDADAELCASAGADLIFNPEPEEMYADGFCSFVDMIGPTAELCGKSRPIHFRGVCTVVSKLFNIVQPDRAYFGQKDAQQLAVIKRMVTDLNIPVEIIGCPIIREADGLAKSSRNTYLNEEERKAALILSKTIFMGQELVKNGLTDAAELISRMKENIETEPLAKIDYVDVVNFDDVSRKDTIGDNTLVAMAVYVGKARLLDNFIIEKK